MEREGERERNENAWRVSTQKITNFTMKTNLMREHHLSTTPGKEVIYARSPLGNTGARIKECHPARLNPSKTGQGKQFGGRGIKRPQNGGIESPAKRSIFSRLLPFWGGGEEQMENPIQGQVASKNIHTELSALRQNSEVVRTVRQSNLVESDGGGKLRDFDDLYMPGGWMI